MNGLTNDTIIAVGKAILPYLPSEISAEALGALSWDAAVALRRTMGEPQDVVSAGVQEVAPPEERARNVATRQTWLNVEAQPWLGLAVPVDCRVEIDYVDEDEWVVKTVEIPVEVTRNGPFEMPRPTVRLTADHPLGAGIIEWTTREPGAVEISDHVRDCLGDLAADPRGSD